MGATRRPLSQQTAAMDLPSYITGLCEGEACFTVSFSLRRKLRLGIEVRPSFSLSQHKRNLEVVKLLREYFGAGGIRFSRPDQNYKFEVRGIEDLMKTVIPHFRKYELLSRKKHDFERFAKVCELVHASKHKSLTGMRSIISLAYEMNPSGRRKHQKDKLLRLLDKVKE